MDALFHGLVTLINGVFNAAVGIANPVVVALVICGVALAWLALVEVDLLNRQGTKPRIGRH